MSKRLWIVEALALWYFFWFFRNRTANTAPHAAGWETEPVSAPGFEEKRQSEHRAAEEERGSVWQAGMGSDRCDQPQQTEETERAPEERGAGGTAHTSPGGKAAVTCGAQPGLPSVRHQKTAIKRRIRMPLAVPVFGLPPSGQTHVSAAASKAETLESESKTQSARKVARAAVAPPAPRRTWPPGSTCTRHGPHTDGDPRRPWTRASHSGVTWGPDEDSAQEVS